MPFKFHASRRHHIPRAKYRVMNWPDMTVVWFGAATFVSGLMRAPWSNGTQPSGELLVASGGFQSWRFPRH